MYTINPVYYACSTTWNWKQSGSNTESRKRRKIKVSDKPYQKECIFCKTKIMMSKESGKWLPYNLNNGPHNCKKKHEDAEKVNNKVKEIEKEKQRTTLTVDEIVKRLKSIGINIGINIDFDIFLRSTE